MLSTLFRALHRAPLLILLAALCNACDRSGTDSVSSTEAVADHSADSLGAVGDTPILRADLERPLQLPLYDLALQRYRLLREALEAAVLARLDTGDATRRSAELRLEPPFPPRLQVEPDSRRVRPLQAAPITLLAFCNFESPHCARLQLQLDRVLPLFGDTVRFAARDFALPFHRHAGLAAQAARCALEQDRYWRFYELMFAIRAAPDRARIDRVARAAQLDPDRFDTCLADGHQGAAVTADFELALALGIDAVPALFVNGLYAGRNPSPEQLIWLVERELARLGLPSPRAEAASRPTGEALTLRALLHSTQPGQGLVMLSPAGAPQRVGSYREGDAVGTHLTVRRITPERVEFLNDGVSEWLGFDSAAPTESGPGKPDEALTAEETVSPERLWPHRAVPVTLDRTEVLVKLADRPALEQLLETVPMTAGGYHLLRIAEIPPGSLYELLGLEPGDAIVAVNEQPVHEGENPLWYALQSENEVRLRVIRRGGLARHFTYRFDE